MKKLIASTLAFAMLANISLARAQLTPPVMAAVSAREFFVGRDQGKPLLTVHLLNGVGSPGVYHIPMDTDLAQLIAYAGGASERADLSEITIRRGTRGNYKILDIDLHKSLKDSNEIFKLQDNDVVQIDSQFSAERPLQWVGIISAIASVVLSVYLVKDIQNKN